MDGAAIKDGTYTVIIISAKGEQGEKSGKYRVLLELVVVFGQELNKHFDKAMFFSPEELLAAKTRFNRMGGQLRGWESLAQDAVGLIGNKLVVEVRYIEKETSLLTVKIHGYVGKDNPQKYCPR